MKRLGTLAAAALVALAGLPAIAADCTGHVVGVKPITHYNHAAGNGFLAVRTGPGTNFPQLGELYLGDEFWVVDRQGKWFLVDCMTGRCRDPLWGAANPMGWVYGSYISIGGVCP
ncbi:SH3 domain-containing protein [Rhodovulum adriaticum]|uniref:SH3 domain-containing protein n=1 Tax=Rhodovulum adriaticum TaxID=35804 RepID=A0A4R2NN50_RHOAD|nr:SH3 domain-containing protein [Rhodovulum adriaticum]TCP22718.1 SH3 domain-containing protein [Rhodovulum adriaticum]